eukprot:63630-Amphidinium_carterae.1
MHGLLIGGASWNDMKGKKTKRPESNAIYGVLNSPRQRVEEVLTELNLYTFVSPRAMVKVSVSYTHLRAHETEADL